MKKLRYENMKIDSLIYELTKIPIKKKKKLNLGKCKSKMVTPSHKGLSSPNSVKSINEFNDGKANLNLFQKKRPSFVLDNKKCNLLKEYNSLKDINLVHYFQKSNNRQHLMRHNFVLISSLFLE